MMTGIKDDCRYGGTWQGLRMMQGWTMTAGMKDNYRYEGTWQGLRIMTGMEDDDMDRG
jgi:hypothetical protein